MRKGYTTYDDAVHHEVVVPLGEHTDDFDVEAIAEEVIGEEGVGVDLIFIPIVNDSEFWQIVERHAIK